MNNLQILNFESRRGSHISTFNYLIDAKSRLSSFDTINIQLANSAIEIGATQYAIDLYLYELYNNYNNLNHFDLQNIGNTLIRNNIFNLHLNYFIELSNTESNINKKICIDTLLSDYYLFNSYFSEFKNFTSNCISSNWAQEFTVKSISEIVFSLDIKNPFNKKTSAFNNTFKVVNFSFLPHYGRFAHQVFEYIYLKYLCYEFKLELHTPYWIGDYIFDLNDYHMSSYQSTIYLKNNELDSYVKEFGISSIAGKNFFSPGIPENWLNNNYNFITENLHFSSKIIENFNSFLKINSIDCSKLVVIHIRMGDLSHLLDNELIPTLLDWHNKNLNVLKDYTIYIASDNSELLYTLNNAHGFLNISNFSKSSNISNWLIDFLLMCHSEVLVISSYSGFSKLAAVLNKSVKNNNLFYYDNSSNAILNIKASEILL